MNKSLFSKTLAIGIIVLFISVGIHPGFAADIQQPLQNENNEENCGCEELKTSNLVSSNFILKRVRKMVNRIDLLFGHYPEIADICKNITQILDVYNPILCEISIIISTQLFILWASVEEFFRRTGLLDTTLARAIIGALLFAWGLSYVFVYMFCEEEPYYIS